MLDTILISLDKQIDHQGLSALSNRREIIDYKTGELREHRGKLKNLNVKTDERGTIVRGSLPRYVKGSNLKTLTLNETKEAISRLEDALHIDLRNARVYRLDVAGNLMLKRPIDVYLRLCGDAPRYQKTRFDAYEKYGGGTVMYGLKRRSLLLYDKLAEMRANGREQNIPEDLQGKNVLRCEMQLKKRVEDQLKWAVTVKDLYDPQFLAHVVGRWEEEFLGVRKYRKLRLTEPTNVKELVSHLALLGMESIGGEEAVLALLEDARGVGLLNYQQSYRLKKKVQGLYDHEGLTAETEAAKEFESKLQKLAAYPCPDKQGDRDRKAATTRPELASEAVLTD